MASKRQPVNLPAGFRQEDILALHYALQDACPQVYAWVNRQEDFGDLRLKQREDGTVLAIAKGYGEDGTPIVAFGSGYDCVSALKGLEGALARNGWRPDKPWQPSSNGKGGA